MKGRIYDFGRSSEKFELMRTRNNYHEKTKVWTGGQQQKEKSLWVSFTTAMDWARANTMMHWSLKLRKFETRVWIWTKNIVQELPWCVFNDDIIQSKKMIYICSFIWNLISRLFCEDRADMDGKSQNIPAGTVVDHGVTNGRLYDFFLCSHAGLMVIYVFILCIYRPVLFLFTIVFRVRKTNGNIFFSLFFEVT